jgi:hypothetical protein
MLIATTLCTKYVEHQFDFTHKCIKVIYISYLSTQSSHDLESIS